MVVYDLFFGRNIEGRAPVSDVEWAAFVDRVITPNLPDGFTVFDGYGQWRNPATGAIVRDPTKILMVAVPSNRGASQAIDAVKKAYEKEFNQQSVGMIVHAACAGFAD